MKLFFFLLSLAFFQMIYGEEGISPASLLADQIKRGMEHQEERYLSALISGIEARDGGIVLSQEETNICPVYVEKLRKFESAKNLNEAERRMKEVQAIDGVNILLPLRLAYAVIKEGKGEKLTYENGKLSVNFTISKIGDHFPESIGKEVELDVSEVIPGLAHGIVGMREGEIRTLYIHPEWAYQSDHFDPNVALEVTIQLVKILPSERGIFPPIPQSKIFNAELKEVEQLRWKDYYVLGWKLWDHLRWGYRLFSKEELISGLRAESLKKTCPDELDKIHWQIYRQSIEDEDKAASSYLKSLSDVKCLIPELLYCRTLRKQARTLLPTSFLAKMIIKDKEGKILYKRENVALIVSQAIKGVREAFPYLIPKEPAVLFIHPRLAYPDADGPLGNKLLIMEITMNEEDIQCRKPCTE